MSTTRNQRITILAPDYDGGGSSVYRPVGEVWGRLKLATHTALNAPAQRQGILEPVQPIYKLTLGPHGQLTGDWRIAHGGVVYALISDVLNHVTTQWEYLVTPVTEDE